MSRAIEERIAELAVRPLLSQAGSRRWRSPAVTAISATGETAAVRQQGP